MKKYWTKSTVNLIVIFIAALSLSGFSVAAEQDEFYVLFPSFEPHIELPNTQKKIEFEDTDIEITPGDSDLPKVYNYSKSLEPSGYEGFYPGEIIMTDTGAMVIQHQDSTFTNADARELMEKDVQRAKEYVDYACRGRFAESLPSQIIPKTLEPIKVGNTSLSFPQEAKFKVGFKNYDNELSIDPKAAGFPDKPLASLFDVARSFDSTQSVFNASILEIQELSRLASWCNTMDASKFRETADLEVTIELTLKEFKGILETYSDRFRKSRRCSAFQPSVVKLTVEKTDVRASKLSYEIGLYQEHHRCALELKCSNYENCNAGLSCGRYCTAWTPKLVLKARNPRNAKSLLQIAANDGVSLLLLPLKPVVNETIEHSRKFSDDIKFLRQFVNSENAIEETSNDVVATISYSLQRKPVNDLRIIYLFLVEQLGKVEQ